MLFLSERLCVVDRQSVGRCHETVNPKTRLEVKVVLAVPIVLVFFILPLNLTQNLGKHRTDCTPQTQYWGAYFSTHNGVARLPLRRKL